MGYIAADDILKAREMDLMTYLRNYEPQELVRVSGNTYCTREHESLRISNGKWYWFSHDVGGRSALDYLIKVKDYSFIDAVKTILGNAAVKEPIPYHQKEKVNRDLLMPKLDDDTSQIEKYLYSRGIHPAVTLYCIEKKLLYQTAEYHNLPSHIILGEDFGLKKPSMVLLEQIQTVNKDELTDYIGSVNDERLWKQINAALKKTFGLWIYNTDRNGDVRCLCPKCLSDYIHDPNYVVRRLDLFAKSKDNCDKCNNSGWDYIVYDKRTSVKGKGCKNA